MNKIIQRLDRLAIRWAKRRHIPGWHFRCVECKVVPATGLCGNCMRRAIQARPKTGGAFDP